jgi:hypothetical protein
MRERKELAAGQLPASVRCIDCSSDGKLVAFGHVCGVLSVFKALDLFKARASFVDTVKNESAGDSSMFWRSQPGSVTTANLFASSVAAAKSAGSKTKSSASAATASELLAVDGCVYAGVHRRENIADLKFSPCGRCVYNLIDSF